MENKVWNSCATFDSDGTEINCKSIKYRVVIETETENGEKTSWTAFVASYEDIVDIMNGIGMYGNFPTVGYKVDKLEIDDPISVVRAICDKCICHDTDIWL